MTNADMSDPRLMLILPGRVAASFEVLSYSLATEQGDDTKGGRELTGDEEAVHRAALETIRLYITGDIKAEPPTPQPDLSNMIRYHEIQAANLRVMQEQQSRA